MKRRDVADPGPVTGCHSERTVVGIAWGRLPASLFPSEDSRWEVVHGGETSRTGGIFHVMARLVFPTKLSLFLKRKHLAAQISSLPCTATPPPLSPPPPLRRPPRSTIPGRSEKTGHGISISAREFLSVAPVAVKRLHIVSLVKPEAAPHRGFPPPRSPLERIAGVTPCMGEDHKHIPKVPCD